MGMPYGMITEEKCAEFKTSNHLNPEALHTLSLGPVKRDHPFAARAHVIDIISTNRSPSLFTSATTLVINRLPNRQRQHRRIDYIIITFVTTNASTTSTTENLDTYGLLAMDSYHVDQEAWRTVHRDLPLPFLSFSLNANAQRMQSQSISSIDPTHHR